MPMVPAPASPAPPPEPAGASLREVLTHLFYDRRRLMVVLLLGLVATGIAVWMTPTRYVAEASLLLRLGREYIYTPEVGDTAPGAPVAYDLGQTLMSETRILTSRDTLEMALAQIGVDKLYPALARSPDGVELKRARAVQRMEQAIKAELMRGSNLLSISFTHPDAQMSAQALGQLIEAYLKRRATVLSGTGAGFEFAKMEFDQRRQQLDLIDARLTQFKQEHAIQSFAEEQSLLLAQRNTLEQRQTDNQLALAQANGRAQALRSAMQKLPETVVLSSETRGGDAVEHARKVLLDLRLKERDLASKFSERHVLVQDVRADIELTQRTLHDLEDNPAKAVRTGRSPALDAGEQDLLRAQAEEQQAGAGARSLGPRLAAIDRRLGELTQAEAGLRQLERERRLAESAYDSAAKRLRDESAMKELDRRQHSSVSVVEAPRVPLQADSLRTVVAVVGVFITFCVMLLTAFLSALWRDTYLSPEQLERDLDAPVLAAVPRSGA